MAPRSGDESGVVVVKVPNKQCTFALYGKIVTSVLIQFIISLETSFEKYHERCKQAGYQLLETPWNLDETPEISACIKYGEREWKYKLSVDERFEKKGYVFHTYKLPDEALKREESILTIRVNEIDTQVRVSRMDLENRVRPTHVFSNIHSSYSTLNLTMSNSILSTLVPTTTGKEVDSSSTILSIGTDLEGDLVDNLIKLDTSIPTKKERRYTTTRDNQTKMSFKICEGERPFIKDNRILGEFVLTNLPAGPGGSEDVDFTVKINTLGSLLAKAVSVSNDKISNQIEIPYDKLRARRDEATDMINQAAANKSKDEAEASRVRAWSRLNSRAHEIKLEIPREMPSEPLKLVTEKCKAEIAWVADHKEETREVYDNRRNNLETTLTSAYKAQESAKKTGEFHGAVFMITRLSNDQSWATAMRSVKRYMSLMR